MKWTLMDTTSAGLGVGDEVIIRIVSPILCENRVVYSVHTYQLDNFRRSEWLNQLFLD